MGSVSAHQDKSNLRRRSRQIAGVLARHGLGYLVGVLGLEGFVPFQRGWLGHPRRSEPYARPEHVRMALEELGATAIKLGQTLSTRPDLLPPAYQRELAKLQDAAPPVASAVVQDLLLAELDRPLDELFASFESEPLAAASIGQAHAARLRDGASVVVKIRRPGVVEQVETDLDLLQRFARVASHRWELASQYDVVGLAQEFAQTLRAELDYVREGRNAERFAVNFARDRAIHIPQIYWEATTAGVLTLERIEGIKIDDLAALDTAGIDRATLAEHAAHVILKMVFEDGFFHADPHPGNFFIEADGRIGLIDFGMVGTIDERTREQLVRLLVAITSQDSDRLVDALLELGMARQRVDRLLLRQDLQRLLARYYGRALGEMAIGQLLEESLALVRRHHLQLPATLALLFKTVAMNEGLGVRLDPDFHLAGLLAPYVQRLLLRYYSPVFWAERLGRAGLDAAWLGTELPQKVRRLVAELERGGLEVGMRPAEFEPLLHRFERLANRLVLGIIVAAFIIGLAVLMSFYHPAGAQQWMGAMFAVGFATAVALAGYLAWNVLRSGRR